MIPAPDHSVFEIDVEELEGGGHQVTAGRFRFVDEGGLSSIRPPEWLIENFLPQGSYAILFGAPGTFKTFIALDIALSIATGVGMGEQAYWNDIITTGPVLFVAGEGRFSLVNRIRAWKKVHFFGNDVENFVLADPVPLVTEDLQPFLNGALIRRPDGYKLVVLDTVGRSMQGVNENSQEHASAYTNLVERIQKELNTTVLALHHSGHNSTNRARGSSVFGADADTIIRADRQGKDFMVSLAMTKQKDAAEWENKKFIKLNRVSLGLETESLVAVKPGNNEHPKGEKFHPTEGEIECLMDNLGEAVTSYLKSDTSKEWSQIALAEAVATDDRIKIGSSQLRQRYLKDLRKDKSQPASRYYNGGTGKWCYDGD